MKLAGHERHFTDIAGCHRCAMLPAQLAVGSCQGTPLGAEVTSRRLHWLTVDLQCNVALRPLLGSCQGTCLAWSSARCLHWVAVVLRCLAWSSARRLHWHSVNGGQRGDWSELKDSFNCINRDTEPGVCLHSVLVYCWAWYGAKLAPTVGFCGLLLHQQVEMSADCCSFHNQQSACKPGNARCSSKHAPAGVFMAKHRMHSECGWLGVAWRAWHAPRAAETTRQPG